MSEEHWPPFCLAEYIGSDHFQDQMAVLVVALNHEYPGVSGEDAVFDAVADFVDRAHRAAEEGEPFGDRFPNESAVRVYIKVAAGRDAIRRRSRQKKEVAYDPEILESTVEARTVTPDVLVVEEQAEKEAQVIAYIAQIIQGEEDDIVGLPSREREVISRLWMGEKGVEIARFMKLSPSTVSKIRDDAFQKIRRHFRL